MITTNRDVILGGHTTPDVKDAIREEARKRRLSMSALIHEVLRDYFRSKGYPVTAYEYKVQDGQPQA